MTFQRDLAWKQIELTYQSSVSYQIGRYACALKYSLLPDNVVHQAKRCTLDALGCAIGAYVAPGRIICEETAKELGGPAEATVFCSGMRTSATSASLVNAFLVRFLDYTDMGGGGHNSDALASILAVAERQKASGKDFLTSLVISYELGARFRHALTDRNSLEPKGWTTDIRAGLNQPPAIGKLMGLNAEQIANAIGLCLSHTLPMGILDADREENVMAKNLRFGWAAHDAIIACLLAKKGFTGPLRIMESDWGVRKVILDGAMDFEKLTDFSGWHILKTVFKAICANGSSQAPVFATIDLVTENDLKPEDVAEVHIRTGARTARHTTTPSKKYPRNAESADHSTFYSNALAIVEREFKVASTDPRKFTNPVVLDLIERMTVEPDSTMSRNQGSSEIITRDGRRFYKRIDEPHGLSGDSLTDQELETKFAEMATKYMPDSQIRKIFDTCWNLEKLDDIGRLAKLMVFPKKRS